MRRWACLLGWIAISGFIFGESATESLRVPHPGRYAARQLAAEGTKALEREELETASSLLQQALEQDPLLVAAWNNYSVAQIRLCRPLRARAAATIVLRLDPSNRSAARNLRLARELECAAVEPALTLEWRVPAEASHESLPDWAAAARGWRGKGKRLLAALFEGWAIEAGEGGGGSRARLSEDLEAAGLLRSALEVLEEGSEGLSPEVSPRAAMIRRRIAGLEPGARLQADRAALVAGWREPRRRLGLERMAEVLLAQGASPEAAYRRLKEMLHVGRPQPVEQSWGRCVLPFDWAVIELPAGEETPLLTLRRFPGDSQICAFAMPRLSGAEAGEAIERLFSNQGMALAEPWKECSLTQEEGATCHEARFEADLGPEGRSAIVAYRLEDEESGRGILLLTLTSDSGCGKACLDGAEASVAEVLASFQVDFATESWPLQGANRARFPVPAAWLSPRVHEERRDPWRTVRLSDDLVMDLPPGMVAATLGDLPLPFDPPLPMSLWFRGQMVDQQGLEVRIGDERWYGSARVREDRENLFDRHRKEPILMAPPADPSAKLLGSASLAPALARFGLDSRGLAARFQGMEFPGQWFVFEVWIQQRLVEIWVPVVHGERSLSLLYVPLTVRVRGTRKELPPIVDLSSRYEVRFDRFEDPSRRADPREGLLYAAELQVPIPKEFRVSLNASSPDGFPITARQSSTGSQLTIRRWPLGADARIETLQHRATLEEGGSPVRPWRRGRRSRGGVSWLAYFGQNSGEPPNGERCLVLVTPLSGASRPAYLLRLERGEAMKDDEWKVACRLIFGARYRRRP